MQVMTPQRGYQDQGPGLLPAGWRRRGEGPPRLADRAARPISARLSGFAVDVRMALDAR